MRERKPWTMEAIRLFMRDYWGESDALEMDAALTFERLDDGTIRVTDNTIQDAVRDVVKRLADAKETALKEAIKSLGWIAPEDIAAHDAQVAAQALRDARDMLANSPAVTIAGPGGALELLDAEIDRIEALRVEE